MIVSVLQENLLRALSRTSRILSARPQLPVLSMALIEAGPGRLTITTTNMETTEIVSVAAKTEKEGSTCVSSRLLTELISSLRPDTVTLSVEDGALLVSSGRTRATIPGAPSSEFPPVAVQEGKGTPIEKKEISAALSRVLFAAAIDDSRPLLTGVVLKKQKDDLVIAATDGYRLSVSTVGLSFSEDDNLVVPARALAEVVKVGNEE
ncbi:MAG TPA: DNA polymerase III subunit beta, partial [Candidatus Paceibacterota bacterium]